LAKRPRSRRIRELRETTGALRGIFRVEGSLSKFLATRVENLAVAGSFDCVIVSLRSAITSLRMTGGPDFSLRGKNLFCGNNRVGVNRYRVLDALGIATGVRDHDWNVAGLGNTKHQLIAPHQPIYSQGKAA